MKTNPLADINRYCRYGIGFLYIYHGLVPKIIWLSPIEISLVQLTGTGVSAEFFSPIAGVLEIFLGLCVIFLRNTIYPVYVSAILLVFLLIYTALTIPSLLVEAFNPVSTNFLGLLLCYMTIKTQLYKKQND